MRRLGKATVPLALMFIAGCVQRYEKRMDQTVAQMKYDLELKKNLEDAPTGGHLKDFNIYVRPPKGMQPAKNSLLGDTLDLFDVQQSFLENGKNSQLNIVARRKAQKSAATKGAPAQPLATRGEFNSDVLQRLKDAFGDDENIALEKFKDDQHKFNKFRRAIFTSNQNKKVEVFLMKADPYDVALIYVFDPAEEKTLTPKINYSLEAFALGDKARAKYSGSTDAEIESGAAPAAPAAF